MKDQQKDSPGVVVHDRSCMNRTDSMIIVQNDESFQEHFTVYRS